MVPEKLFTPCTKRKGMPVWTRWQHGLTGSEPRDSPRSGQMGLVPEHPMKRVWLEFSPVALFIFPLPLISAPVLQPLSSNFSWLYEMLLILCWFRVYFSCLAYICSVLFSLIQFLLLFYFRFEIWLCLMWLKHGPLNEMVWWNLFYINTATKSSTLKGSTLFFKWLNIYN